MFEMGLHQLKCLLSILYQVVCQNMRVQRGSDSAARKHTLAITTLCTFSSFNIFVTTSTLTRLSSATNTFAGTPGGLMTLAVDLIRDMGGVDVAVPGLRPFEVGIEYEEPEGGVAAASDDEAGAGGWIEVRGIQDVDAAGIAVVGELAADVVAAPLIPELDRSAPIFFAASSFSTNSLERPLRTSPWVVFKFQCCTGAVAILEYVSNPNMLSDETKT
jgi:hypothetical protein